MNSDKTTLINSNKQKYFLKEAMRGAEKGEWKISRRKNERERKINYLRGGRS